VVIVFCFILLSRQKYEVICQKNNRVLQKLVNSRNEKNSRSKERKPLIYGFLGGILLISFYFFVLSFANSFQHAMQEFLKLWYFILPIVAGFGTQVGLYFYIRSFTNRINLNGEVMATGGVSGGSMIICCVHHLFDILPIIGLSAFSLFLVNYQTSFLLFGILSNFVGLSMILGIIQRNNLYTKNNGFLRKLMFLNYDRTVYYVLGISALIFLTKLISTRWF